jgi:hypothetical protein
VLELRYSGGMINTFLVCFPLCLAFVASAYYAEAAWKRRNFIVNVVRRIRIGGGL